MVKMTLIVTRDDEMYLERLKKILTTVGYLIRDSNLATVRVALTRD